MFSNGKQVVNRHEVHFIVHSLLGQRNEYVMTALSYDRHQVIVKIEPIKGSHKLVQQTELMYYYHNSKILKFLKCVSKSDWLSAMSRWINCTNKHCVTTVKCVINYEQQIMGWEEQDETVVQ